MINLHMKKKLESLNENKTKKCFRDLEKKKPKSIIK